MKGSIIILSVFIAGLVTGAFHILPEPPWIGDVSSWVLYALMFLVGVSIGSDKHVWQQFREINFKILLIPITTVVGTGIGMLLFYLIFSFPRMADVFAIGSGLGYYSLSSIIISKVSGETIGVIALLSNIIREVSTLVLTPVLVKYFGKLAPIAAGGATTSDTTLPVILKYSGKEYVLSAIVQGIVLTLLVPFLISFIYSL
jgi:Predicted membrane protein